MRLRILLLLAITVFATSTFAKDVYLSIGGSVGAFRTDLRIFNPSSTKDIQIQAFLLPTGNKDNSTVQPVTITVPKRQMLVFNDVVASLFNGSGLAGIRLKSDDDFAATQRVYATAADGSTNGQFVPGLDSSTAQKSGVVIQLKATGSKGQAGTFRTNVGAVSPNGVAANVTWKLYDKNNVLVGQPFTQVMPPFAVVQPLSMTSFGTNVPSNADFTDAWVSYTSDQPIFAYGSVIDNLNDAGTFIPMQADSGALGAPAPIAKNVFLSIGGSVGVFRTDLRIFNPSPTKDIQIQAFLLPTGNNDNSAVQPKTITVPKRQMLVFNDVVASLFNGSGLAGIRLKSDDDFVATQRVYATAADGSTNGQFVPGLDASTAQKNGVIIQLKANGSKGQSGTFRTNVGGVNPNAVAANVTWRLYDKNNALVGQPMTQTLAPFAVVSPSPMTGFGTNVSSTADFTDAWVSYTSDQPIFAYGSVVDNLNDAGTFIPMQADSGVSASPPAPSGKTFNVTEQNFSFTVSPAIGPNDLKPGDTVTFHITVKDSNHGIELLDPDGMALIPPVIFSPGQVVDKTFTITKNGTYTYFCANSTCGTGHNSMVGEFTVGNPSNGGYPHY